MVIGTVIVLKLGDRVFVRTWICALDPLPEGRKFLKLEPPFPKAITHGFNCFEDLFLLPWATSTSKYRFKGKFLCS